MKKKFLLTLAILSVLTFVGCNDNDTKKIGTLSAPQEVVVRLDGDRSLIIFDEVQNAEYYNIYINNMSVTVKGTGSGTIQYDASNIIKLPQEYNVKVKAFAKQYFDSDFTVADVYSHTSVLTNPILTMDNTILNWNKIDNASFYEVAVKTFNPIVENVYRNSTNSFDFTYLLTQKGEYEFKVRAFSDNSEYETSEYSNTVRYSNSVKLAIPCNMQTYYDNNSRETLLSFVSSENVKDFTININNENYTLNETELSNFGIPSNYKNVYILKLTSYVKHKKIDITSASKITVKIKANSVDRYVIGSDFSNTIECEFISRLATPIISVTRLAETTELRIEMSDNDYLAEYSIYLNEQKYKTIPKSKTKLELPNEAIAGKGIRVQAISNNNNCNNSQLSDVKYMDASLTNTGERLEIEYNDGVISWNSITGATNYYVEVYNTTYYQRFVTNQINVSIEDLELEKYTIKVISMADGYYQVENTLEINHKHELGDIKNIKLTKEADGTYVEFDKVEGAYGYVIYLDGTMVNTLYTEPKINVSLYFSVAKVYKVKVRAVGLLNNNILPSNLSEELSLQNTITLTAPVLKINDSVSGMYYLSVDVDESLTALSSGFEVWIDYVYIDTYTYEDHHDINVTGQINNAGLHHFMVKVLPVEGNDNVNAVTESISYIREKQLDTIQNIKLNENTAEGTYMLSFDRNMLAEYSVTIVKQGDESNSIKLIVNDTIVDISTYIKGNGTYKIDVEAIPLDITSPYKASGPSGNPVIITKGTTLENPSNISITKRVGGTSNGEIDVTWNKVNNCDGYQIYVYYDNYGKRVLKKSEYISQSNAPTYNIGTGSDCINKEGVYTIQIKAVGDGKQYINSQITSQSYQYEMVNIADFQRTNIFIYGNNYTYYIRNSEDLKNLLWYHYLYNQDVWINDNGEYNLKIYCDKDLDILAGQISNELQSRISSMATDADKMPEIARELLNKYPEMFAYTEGFNEFNFCVKNGYVYTFRYQASLEHNKLQNINAINQEYNDAVSVVADNDFYKRSTQYVFSIDNKPSVDVINSEQLFMAIQYNKKPNFVGDCEVAKAIYENARFILRQICSDEMTDYEKIRAIYEFLTKNVVYNTNIISADADDEVVASDGDTLYGNLKDLYLESILYNENSESGIFVSLEQFRGRHAVAEGIAKTFVVLCGIEGIDSIKVDGNISLNKHVWNKVYIDIDTNDMDTNKQWYVIDIASAIKNVVEVTESLTTKTYQIGMHNYFLITDADLTRANGAQATKWHTRLGNNANYVAETSFNYYTYEKYSCKFNGNTIVDNADFMAGGSDADIQQALIYGMLKTNKRQRVVVDIYAEEYISNKGEDGAISQITGQIYSNARNKLEGQYNCEINVKVIDSKYIVLILKP